MIKKIFSNTASALCALTITCLTSASVYAAQQVITAEPVNNTSSNNTAKQQLMAKLASIDFFSASFTQQILNEQGDLLQKGSGELAISKPNLVHWKTIMPDETLIVSDGNALWFYDPFIEQANVYSLANAIHNTPILLLTSDEPQLWQQYHVASIKVSAVNASAEQHYSVMPLSTNSQIKQLTIRFSGDGDKMKLAGFSFTDATNQLSQINLVDLNTTDKPASSLFAFSLPEGSTLEDNR